MILLYNLGIFIYTTLIHILSPFNSKASLWTQGRKNWRVRYREVINPRERNIWVHCASLGEFEQGRPVIEKIKSKHPEYKLILTFFSPSGYEIIKGTAAADSIIYLPSDSPANAARFIELVNPEFVIFVKYEFWYNYISVLYRNHIPLYLVSAIFRPGQHFFRWYGSFFRVMLGRFAKIFVQDQTSKDLLNAIGLENIYITGDTRFDRVARITANAKEITQIGQFRGGEKLFLAGSSWKRDEEIITRYINSFPGKMKWVFAPHEIDNPNIERLEKLLNVKHVRYSRFNSDSADARVMIIDNIGMLSSAYRYAYIAEVGGGFGSGIHNILEPACWGVPVLFGPNYEKYREAVELINENGAITFDSYAKFSDILEKLLDDEMFYLKYSKTAGIYITKNTGATGRIMQELFR